MRAVLQPTTATTPRTRPLAMASISGRDPARDRPPRESGRHPRAEVGRQILVGEAGHQVHAVARDVYARRIAVSEGFHGAGDNLSGGPLGIVRIEADVRSEEHTV